MSDAAEQALQRAISTISQSDPLIKLVQQVKLGRMQAADTGLRAITESWLSIYEKVIETTVLNRRLLARLDPTPRVALLIEAGVLPPGHRAVSSLQCAFEKACANAGTAE